MRSQAGAFPRSPPSARTWCSGCARPISACTARPSRCRGSASSARRARASVRYSVPHQLVRAHVEVHVGDHAVSIYHGPHLIATHARRWEPHTHVIEATHFHGLWSQPPRELEEPTTPAGSPLAALGRSLHDYAVAVAEVGG